MAEVHLAAGQDGGSIGSLRGTIGFLKSYSGVLKIELDAEVLLLDITEDNRGSASERPRVYEREAVEMALGVERADEEIVRPEFKLHALKAEGDDGNISGRISSEVVAIQSNEIAEVGFEMGRPVEGRQEGRVHRVWHVGDVSASIDDGSPGAIRGVQIHSRSIEIHFRVSHTDPDEIQVVEVDPTRVAQDGCVA